MENESKIHFEIETATGRKLGVVADPQHGLFRVQYVDGKGGGLPTKLQGRYTGVKFAQIDLEAFVEQTHTVADAHTKTRKPKVDETVAA